MTITQLRIFIVSASLGLTGLTLLFFIMAQPVFGYPLHGDDAWDIAQISLPVFLGFLGSAAQFIIHGKAERRRSSPLLTTLIVGPTVVYLVVLISLLFAFGWGNRPGAADGGAMGPDLLKTIYTALLGILAITSNISTGLLFRSAKT